jgi:hypothetical protein
MKLGETIQRLSRIDIKGWRNDVAITHAIIGPIGGENTSKYIVQAPKSSEPLMTVLATHSPFHRLWLTFLFSVAGRTMSHQLLQVYLQWNAWIPSSMSPVILQCIPAYPNYWRKNKLIKFYGTRANNVYVLTELIVNYTMVKWPEGLRGLQVPWGPAVPHAWRQWQRDIHLRCHDFVGGKQQL